MNYENYYGMELKERLELALKKHGVSIEVTNRFWELASMRKTGERDEPQTG